MLWFFERGGDRLYYEIRRSFDEGRYELSIRYPDGFERLDEPSFWLRLSRTVVASVAARACAGR